ncbi:hypothetical protein GE09DRAFT_411927 [Coniochaeta sp. 2T2.1]|nr:hypothetical protein GE09DRAFT_411927 [Coniochaeta sp. 2T2.1]
MTTSPEYDAARLYVYIHITQHPPTVDIEFPWDHREVAKRYRHSIDRSKKRLCPEVADRSNLVSFHLPSSVVRLSTSRWLHAIILHFKEEADAAAWSDAVCVPVRGHPRQLYIRQYWKAEHWAELNVRFSGQPEGFTDSEPTVVPENVPQRPRGVVRIPKDDADGTKKKKKKRGPEVIAYAGLPAPINTPAPPYGTERVKRPGKKSRDESPVGPKKSNKAFPWGDLEARSRGSRGAKRHSSSEAPRRRRRRASSSSSSSSSRVYRY